MKKFIYLAATAALAIAASCSKSETVEPAVLQERSAVSFGTYTGRALETKAGAAGLMDIALLKTTGFGVMGYASDASAGETGYSQSLKPNFMYNEPVTFVSDQWKTATVKYWPNEHGDKAASGVVDKVTFFAYAPYVAAASGTEGIIGMTDNNTAGDPKITYKVAAKPEDNVDLVWGIAPEDVSWATANLGTINIANGMPYIDLVKPKTNGSVNLLFKHATAKLGFQVLGVFDEGEKDSKTKITVKSVTVKGQFARQGVLNLNNTDAGVARWESPVYDDNTDPSNPFSVITVDQTHNLATGLIDAGDVAFASQPDGVTTSAQNLLADDVQFNLIPGSISEVEIDYFVTTDDALLYKGYSRIENKIKYTFATPLALANNNAYTLKLQLGMTTFKVSATVAGWSGQPETAIDLPGNVEP